MRENDVKEKISSSSMMDYVFSRESRPLRDLIGEDWFSKKIHKVYLSHKKDYFLENESKVWKLTLPLSFQFFPIRPSSKKNHFEFSSKILEFCFCENWKKEIKVTGGFNILQKSSSQSFSLKNFFMDRKLTRNFFGLI